MPSPAFFRALGLFIREGFFEGAECARLVAAARVAPQRGVKISREAWSKEEADETVRRSHRAELPEEMEQFIVQRLQQVMPAIARHFDVAVSKVERPQLLTYRPGDFFVLHRDLDRNAESGRVVSLIAFLESPGETTYIGGALTLYTAIGDEPRPMPLTASAGLLLGFRSEVWHEVQPVISGERHTIVSWLL